MSDPLTLRNRISAIAFRSMLDPFDATHAITTARADVTLVRQLGKRRQDVLHVPRRDHAVLRDLRDHVCGCLFVIDRFVVVTEPLTDDTFAFRHLPLLKIQLLAGHVSNLE